MRQEPCAGTGYAQKSGAQKVGARERGTGASWPAGPALRRSILAAFLLAASLLAARRVVPVALALLAAAIGAFAPALARDLSSSLIVIDADGRLAPDLFARANGLSPLDVATRFGATGAVHCGGAVGTGQLVGAAHVLVTAAHVLFAPDGTPRASGPACRFDIEINGYRRSLPIDLDRAAAGSRAPYEAPAVEDWAVVPLDGPVAGARPYPLAPPLAVPGDVVLAAAASARGVTRLTLERCRAHKVTARAPEGQREVAIDCDAEGGTSGAALLTADGGFLGVYVGFRSSHPGAAGPFSMSHYNFAVTAEGPLRRAISNAARTDQALVASP